MEHGNNALATEIQQIEMRRLEVTLLQAKEKDCEKEKMESQQLVEQLEKHKVSTPYQTTYKTYQSTYQHTLPTSPINYQHAL